MSEIPVIVSACRTAIGAFNGSLASVPAASLGSACIKSLFSRLDTTHGNQKLKINVHEVILGQVLQAGNGQNPARQAALNSGLVPDSTPAITINKVCGSGLKAVMLAAQNIIVDSTINKNENNKFYIAGGMENMSLSPRLMMNPRVAYRMGDITLKDSMIVDGLWCAFNDYHMGVTAENIVKKHNITRLQQDEFSFNSQKKAVAAIESGRFKEEIIPVEIKDRKGIIKFEVDEFPRKDVTMEGLAKLKPAFAKDGTVTAGNSSGLNDGAAALMLCSKKTAQENNLKILAEIRGFASAGVDPSVMGLGVIPAVNKCLKQVGWDINRDVQLIEANEAFAAQSLGVMKELEIQDLTKVNVNGGAIALGHPIGASGARILVTLLHELKRSGKKKGLATLCIGGGQGVAMAIEAP